MVFALVTTLLVVGAVGKPAHDGGPGSRRQEFFRARGQVAASNGHAFDWETEKDNAFIQRLPDYIKEEMAVAGRRNISLLTMAPTGTVSVVKSPVLELGGPS